MKQSAKFEHYSMGAARKNAHNSPKPIALRGLAPVAFPLTTPELINAMDREK